MTNLLFMALGIGICLTIAALALLSAFTLKLGQWYEERAAATSTNRAISRRPPPNGVLL
jgi:hypothetical protein